jgi:16S rRNA C967 or C1407 C5-methylase (RsmB/RsmF family)
LEKPSNLLLKLSRQLFTDSAEQEKFVDALIQPKSFNPCILWCQSKPQDIPFEIETALEWQPEFVDRLSLSAKPGQHPLHDQGFFYCLDFSSVFAASVLLSVSDAIEFIFDMCAAPGGKSIFAWRQFSPQLLLSNEVIGKRTAALISNFKRCNISPACVLSLDSKVLADLIPRSMQLVLVDAPCSGQSLIAKGGKAPGCFHPVNVNKNANRQKRILANSAQLVSPGGYVTYMTCTYSPEENEQVIDWFLERFPNFRSVAIPDLSNFQSHLSEIPCYRIFPQSKLGSGAFTALLQNTESGKLNLIPEDFLSHPKVKHF